jgi:tetratricopeptide (TPR) repeat protein
MASEMERTRQRSQKAKQRGDWCEVVELLEKYRKALPDDKAAALDLGDALMKLERFDQACRFYAELLETWPKDHLIASNFGGALLRCGKIQEAKELLEYSLELNPKNIYARINLGGVYQTLRDYHGALKNSLEAVSIDPTHPLAFNNLGSAFSDLAKFEEAKHAYETAVMLDPNSVDALINLATTEVKLGAGASAIEMFEKVLTMLPPEAKQRAEAVKFFASFEYLRLGELQKGWDYYDGGFSPLVPQNGRRTPVRVFDAPKWNFEDLPGEKILIWREQGLGDELMFSTCLLDLIHHGGGEFIYESDHRLVGAFQRTFPEIEVRPQAIDAMGQSVFKDFSTHLPIGTLPRRFRSSRNDFSQAGIRYLKPSLDSVKAALDWLDSEGATKPLVGICWRSGLIDPTRALLYTEITEWEGLLSNPAVDVVNLQYSECESEIKRAENLYNRRILRPPFDLKNDLESLLGLVKVLNLVVSAHTAVLHLSAIVGTRVVSVETDERPEWVYLGEGVLPWYPNVGKIARKSLGERENFYRLLDGLDG